MDPGQHRPPASAEEAGKGRSDTLTIKERLRGGVWYQGRNGYRARQAAVRRAEGRRLRRRDGRAAAGDLRLRVLHQEPPPARLRQPAQGAAHLRQGSGGQLARRLPRRPASCPRSSSRSRSRRATGRAAAGQPGHALPRHRHDNGPGIVRQQIPPIFAKLLYGSKFHRLRMSRGQQGIGISAAGMYAQLTTGKPVQIISRTGARAAAPTTSRSRSTPRRTSRGSSRARRSTGSTRAAPR